MMNENWLEIVDSYKSSPFQNLSQADAISKALDWFRMLGWKKSNGTMSVASCGEDNDIMPIILSKTSPDGDLLPVIAVVVSRQNVENYADLASKAMSAAGCSLCLIISKEIKVLCKTDTEEETLETKKQQQTSNNKNPEHLAMFGIFLLWLSDNLFLNLICTASVLLRLALAWKSNCCCGTLGDSELPYPLVTLIAPSTLDKACS